MLKFMVTILVPNFSRSVSRADSLSRKQSHITKDSAFSLLKMAGINTSVCVVLEKGIIAYSKIFPLFALSKT